MELKNFAELLKSNTYPGRGIMIGKTKDGTHGVISYFIMGRSENSRNRVFVEDGLGIKTKAFDESKLTDPSLIIYAPVRVIGNTTIVTNGDQTDTIYEALEQGRTFEDALRTRTFEPDAPNFTPRISGEVVVNNGLQFIHTYRCDGNPIPSFEGEPIRVAVEGDIDSFTNTVWDSLNADNKVSLFTCFIQLENGLTETRIINKNK